MPNRTLGAEQDLEPVGDGAPVRPKAEYRAITRDLPDREPLASLTPSGKLLLLMLKLGLGPTGMELMPPRRFRATFEERTGLSATDFDGAVAELCEARCLEIEGSTVWLVGQLDEDPLFSAKNWRQRTKVQRDIAMVPEAPIVHRFRQRYAAFFAPVR